MGLGELGHALANLLRLVFKVCGRPHNILGHLVHVGSGKATAGHRRAAHPDAAGLEGRPGISGHLVFVDGDAHLVQAALQLLAGEVAQVAQIHQSQVVIGTTGHQVHAPAHEPLGQSLGIVHHLLLVYLELRLEGLAQCHRLGGDDVHQRSALSAGEDGGVDLLGQILVVGENHAATGTTQGLVGGGGHHMGVRHRRGVEPSGHQAGNVGHIHPQIGTHLISNGTEAGKVDGSGIGGGTGHDHLGLALLGHPLQLVVVDVAGLLVHAVGHHVVIFAGKIHRAAVGQMSTVVQIHAQNSVPGLAQSHIHSVVGLSSGVGLHIGKLGPVELAGPLDGQGLHHIHALAAAIIALAGVSFCVLVGEHAARCGQHRLRDDVFRGNQLDVVTLSLIFGPDGSTHLRVHVGYKIHILQNHGCSTFLL